MSLDALFYVGVAFALGGILKGASGIGAPFLAVPVMVMFFDVKFAIAVFVIPNIVINVVQFFQMRKFARHRPLLALFCLAGMAGAAAGSYVLVVASQRSVLLGISALIAVFVAWRLARPKWRMTVRTGTVWSAPFGFLGGILQGAVGISAPVSVSYLSLVDMGRNVFIATISMYFLAMGLVQLPILLQLGVMTGERLVYGALAIVPLLAGMPVGNFLGTRMTPEQFNRLLLLLLSAIALRLGYTALA